MEDASGTNGFVNGADSIKEYSFDGNGNPTADLNKGYTNILYNYLNLPKQIATTTEKTKYIYDASGMKLAKVGTENDTSYYAGNFVYKGSSLNYIIHEEGYIDPSEPENYKYYLKDHLGSVRMIVNTNGTGGTIESQKDYYPFGMTIAEYNGSVVDYGYNGKELQNDLINNKKLDWYDYGARFYDPQIGRWNVIDAISEEYPNYTPYCYANNNSIIYIDPDGNDWFYYSADGKSDPTWHWHEGSTYNTGVKDANGNEIVLQGVKPGYTYWSDKGEVILQDNGQWAFTGQKPIDPNCPTCDLNNGNIGWELFQVGAAQYSKLLKAGEIGLEISAYLLLGEVGAGGSLIRSASRVTARETLLNTVTNPRLKRMIDYIEREQKWVTEALQTLLEQKALI